MDFLDPKKQKAHARRLALGYALIGLVLLLGTTILLYLAYGFGIDRNGRVIQNGLVFISSQPAGADIYINGAKKDTTNTRVVLPAGSYTAEIKRTGYDAWKRAITVEGGSVERFDYPFLFPTKLTTTVTKQYAAPPTLTSQSPDRRWLLMQGTASDTFDVYDLNVQKPIPHQVAVSTDLYAPSTVTKGWEAIDWADDNRHLLLRRTFEKSGQRSAEYILFDRADPTASQNLGTLLGTNPTTIELRNHKYDQYYLFDQNAGQVLTASLKKPTPQSLIKDVLAAKADGDLVLYVTETDGVDGKVAVKLRDNDKTYTLRQTSKSPLYLLRIGRYNSGLLVAAGSQSEDKVYVYSNPLDKLKDKDQLPLTPIQILKVPSPTYLSFSTNARFVMAEAADKFAVYDAERDKGYAYQIKTPLDTTGLPHATWMDGFRLTATSGGKLLVFDFDGANPRTLMAANPAFTPFFDRNYDFVYTFNPANALTSTALTVPQ
jgi:hypothetical protein